MSDKTDRTEYYERMKQSGIVPVQIMIPRVKRIEALALAMQWREDHTGEKESGSKD